MIESKLQILNQKDYWVGRNEHYGILCTAHFDSKNKDVEYWIALEPESKYVV